MQQLWRNARHLWRLVESFSAAESLINAGRRHLIAPESKQLNHWAAKVQPQSQKRLILEMSQSNHTHLIQGPWHRWPWPWKPVLDVLLLMCTLHFLLPHAAALIDLIFCMSWANGGIVPLGPAPARSQSPHTSRDGNNMNDLHPRRRNVRRGDTCARRNGDDL